MPSGRLSNAETHSVAVRTRSRAQKVRGQNELTYHEQRVTLDTRGLGPNIISSQKPTV